MSASAAGGKKRATIHDLVANPFAEENGTADAAERDRWAKELYEHNLRELTRIMNSGRGMWCVRLNAVGAIDDSWRCKVSDRPGRDCFTIFMPEAGGVPRFGHGNMLNPSQLNVYPIMQRDAVTIATAQERAHTARKAGLLSEEDAELTLVDLKQRFHNLPPSRSALEEERRKQEDEAERHRLEAEQALLQADEDEMPSFEGLMAAFAEEDMLRGVGTRAAASAHSKQREDGPSPSGEGGGAGGGGSSSKSGGRGKNSKHKRRGKRK